MLAFCVVVLVVAIEMSFRKQTQKALLINKKYITKLGSY